MPDYVQDGNNPKKQVPGPLPDNYFSRAPVVSNISESMSAGGTGLTKTPNSVYINSLDGNVGFYFETSESFAKLNLNITGNGDFSASNGSTQICGSGTQFINELVAGDKIEIISGSGNHTYSEIHIIDVISSSFSMSLSSNWGGGEVGNNILSESSITRRRSFMSKNYKNYGALTTGTELNIHPIAYSGSKGDKVVFIYKGGLDGSPRPF